MDETPHKIPLYDIHEAAHQELNGNEVSLELQGSRVVFEVPATDTTYRLLQEYHANPSVALGDFVRVLKRLRSKMLDLRDGHGQGRYGNDIRRHR